MLPEKLHFSPLSRRLVEASFTGGHITSDAGLLLLREVDRQHGLTRRLAKIVPDRRDPGRVQHGLQTLLAQRIYALAAGYEDLNDHDGLRHDYALQTAVNRLQPLAGKSTLGRLEQQANRETVVQAHRLLWEHFIAQHDQAPAEIVLDFDATDVPVHGDQEGRFFHGYYDHYCFLPLYVFCGRHLLVSYLRPSNIDGARHSWAILALLVKFIRRFWPETRIVSAVTAVFADVACSTGVTASRWIMWWVWPATPACSGWRRRPCKRSPRPTKKPGRRCPACIASSIRPVVGVGAAWSCRAWNMASRVPIHASSSCPALPRMLPSSTTKTTAAVATWRIGSRTNSWICSPTAPPAHAGGPTSGG